MQVGIVIIAACPGGSTSNLITYLLKGDVALSISLTSINSILILFSIPAITNLALEFFLGKQELISLPFFRTVLKIFLMILLPTFVGILVRRKAPHAAIRIEKIMKYATTFLLAVVFAFTIFANKNFSDTLFRLYLSTAPIVFLLNHLGMFSEYLSGYLARFDKSKMITLVIEIGIQNSALAITIASSQAFLGNPQMAVPALIYGMFTLFNAVVFGYIIKKWIRI